MKLPCRSVGRSVNCPLMSFRSDVIQKESVLFATGRSLQSFMHLIDNELRWSKWYGKLNLYDAMNTKMYRNTFEVEDLLYKRQLKDDRKGWEFHSNGCEGFRVPFARYIWFRRRTLRHETYELIRKKHTYYDRLLLSINYNKLRYFV